MTKSDKFYFDSFSECAAICKSAAGYLVECLENYEKQNIPSMLKKMHELEHSADIKKHTLDDKLAKAFVTPVDR